MKKEALEQWLIIRIAEEIEIEPRMIDTNGPLLNYLMNGFQSADVVRDLERFLGRRLPESILYDRPTISGLSEYLLDLTAKKRQAIRLPFLTKAWNGS